MLPNKFNSSVSPHYTITHKNIAENNAYTLLKPKRH